MNQGSNINIFWFMQDQFTEHHWDNGMLNGSLEEKRSEGRNMGSILKNNETREEELLL